MVAVGHTDKITYYDNDNFTVHETLNKDVHLFTTDVKKCYTYIIFIYVITN